MSNSNFRQLQNNILHTHTHTHAHTHTHIHTQRDPHTQPNKFKMQHTRSMSTIAYTTVVCVQYRFLGQLCVP